VLDLCAAVSISSREQLREKLRAGEAWERFQQMVANQSGDVSVLEHMESIHRAPIIQEVTAAHSGQLTRMDARSIGLAVLSLGAGRALATDPVDFAVGVDRMMKTGRSVSAGDVLLRIHARTQTAAGEALALISGGIQIE
jgi:thymidine phosphorylase